jgi:hypothetical protein
MPKKKLKLQKAKTRRIRPCKEVSMNLPKNASPSATHFWHKLKTKVSRRILEEIEQ